MLPFEKIIEDKINPSSALSQRDGKGSGPGLGVWGFRLWGGGCSMDPVISSGMHQQQDKLINSETAPPGGHTTEPVSVYGLAFLHASTDRLFV